MAVVHIMIQLESAKQAAQLTPACVLVDKFSKAFPVCEWLTAERGKEQEHYITGCARASTAAGILLSGVGIYVRVVAWSEQVDDIIIVGISSKVQITTNSIGHIAETNTSIIGIALSTCFEIVTVLGRRYLAIRSSKAIELDSSAITVMLTVKLP